MVVPQSVVEGASPLRFARVLLFTIVCIASANAQETRDPAVVSVVTAAVGSLGGPSSLSSLTKFTVQGTFTPADKSPLKASSFTWSFDGSSYIFADENSTTSGNDQFTKTVSDGKTRSTRANPQSSFVPQLLAPFLSKSLADTAWSISRPEQIKLDSGSVLKLIVERGDPKNAFSYAKYVLYLNSVSYRPVRIDYNIPATDGSEHSVLVSLEILDYKEMNAALIPSKWSISIDGSPMGQYQIQ